MSNNAQQFALKNNIQRIAGSILLGKELNPLPTTKIKYPCSICNKNCLSNQSCIQCDECDKWCHIKCDGTSQNDYNKLQLTNDNPEIQWFCLVCTMKFHHANIPFTLSDDLELDNINNSENMKFCESLPTLEEIFETSKYSSYPRPMEDANLPSNLNSKYHSVSDVQKLKIEKK